MGFIPGFVIATAVVLAFTLTLLPFISILLGTKGRSAVALGMRMARGHPSETIARALPVALVVALMIASLSVGDGLFDMVERNVDSNLSNVDHIIEVPSFIPQDVCQSSLDALDIGGYATIIQLDAFPGDGDAITLLGVQEGIEDLLPVRAGSKDLPIPPDRYEVYINRELASQQGIGKGDTLRITINIIAGRIGSLLTYTEGGEITLNLTVSEVIDNTGIGRYREDSRDEVDPIAIMDLTLLQERLDRIGMANKVLLNLGSDNMETIEAELDGRLTWAHGGFEILPSPEAGGILIRNDDLMFHSDDINSLPDGGSFTLSYFVDSLSGSSDLSYSVVTGMDISTISSLKDVNDDGVTLQDGEILLDNWTAEKLGASTGDGIKIRYRSVSHIEGFEGTTISLKVAGILPKEGIMAEGELIPSVEGLTEVDSCLDWDPSFEVDLNDISEDDQLYWETYGSAPKGIITLNQARELWETIGGDTSAVWYPGPSVGDAAIRDSLNATVTLSYIGGSIVPVRESALDSSRGMLIFPGMFLTFGSAIIAGALLVFTAVVTDISTRRSRDHSMLKALGFSRSRILTIGAVEGTISILIGSAAGAGLGVILGLFLNRAINSIWSRSVESASVPFSLSSGSLVISISAGAILCVPILLLSIWMHLGKAPASVINREDPSIEAGIHTKPIFYILSAAGIITGIFLLVMASISEMGPTSSAFFTIGSILLSSSSALLLYRIITGVRGTSDLTLMVSANLSRRPGKVPVSITVLALTLSLALSLGFVGSILEEDLESDIGSYGGEYELVIETHSPFTGDLDEITSDIDMKYIAPLLARGDEGGKCSNINAPFPPRLLGYTSPSDMYNFSLIERDASSDRQAWDDLEDTIGTRIPIMVDQNTLQWIYFKGLGDTFTITSEDGIDLELVVVGVLSPSILTGSFVMSGTNLRSMFPETASYTYFLVDSDEPDEAASGLVSAFSNLSPTVTMTDDLARENLHFELSYLSLFRDFLVLGLIVAMVSAAVFTHARAATLGRELELLRTIGVKKRRAVQYFFLENLIVFLLATAGALVGSTIAAIVLSASMGVWPSGLISPVIGISLAFMGVSILVSLSSAFWVLRGYSLLVRRVA